MWECKEHKYADNSSKKFRNPDAFEVRRFARRFEFEEEKAVGAFVPVILPRGVIQFRSGCPNQVVEQILEQEKAKELRTRVILGVGLTAILTIIGFTIHAIYQMDNPTHGWVVLVASLAGIEAASLLYCTDQFLKRGGSTTERGR
jgi:hypothetical protein